MTETRYAHIVCGEMTNLCKTRKTTKETKQVIYVKMAEFAGSAITGAVHKANNSLPLIE